MNIQKRYLELKERIRKYSYQWNLDFYNREVERLHKLKNML